MSQSLEAGRKLKIKVSAGLILFEGYEERSVQASLLGL